MHIGGEGDTDTLAKGVRSLLDTVNFDDLKTSAPPSGWTATKTGKGEAKWEVVADNSAPSKPNVLKQSGEATYPLCIKDDTSFKDGFVKVKFKPISGKEDQAGGLIWRCKDADNYYIARANALENNVTKTDSKRRRYVQTHRRPVPSRIQPDSCGERRRRHHENSGRQHI